MLIFPVWCCCDWGKQRSSVAQLTHSLAPFLHETQGKCCSLLLACNEVPQEPVYCSFNTHDLSLRASIIDFRLLKVQYHILQWPPIRADNSSHLSNALCAKAGGQQKNIHLILFPDLSISPDLAYDWFIIGHSMDRITQLKAHTVFSVPLVKLPY